MYFLYKCMFLQVVLKLRVCVYVNIESYFSRHFILTNLLSLCVVCSLRLAPKTLVLIAEVSVDGVSPNQVGHYGIYQRLNAVSRTANSDHLIATVRYIQSTASQSPALTNNAQCFSNLPPSNPVAFGYANVAYMFAWKKLTTKLDLSWKHFCDTFCHKERKSLPNHHILSKNQNRQNPRGQCF